MAEAIIQWNCRGLRANYNDLLLLLSSVEPVACCLQELLIDDNYVLGNRQYNLYTTLPPLSNNRPTGGAGILVRKTTPHSQLTLHTHLQAVACRISVSRPISVCSLYLPPHCPWSQTDLLALVAQLPTILVVPFAGVLAERIPRQAGVMATQALMAWREAYAKANPDLVRRTTAVGADEPRVAPVPFVSQRAAATAPVMGNLALKPEEADWSAF